MSICVYISCKDKVLIGCTFKTLWNVYPRYLIYPHKSTEEVVIYLSYK